MQRVRAERGVFSWDAQDATPRSNRAQLRSFEEATTYGIRSGITVPIRGGFGQMAAFTLATDDPLMRPDHVLAGSGDIVQFVGIYFYAHLSERTIATSVAAKEAAPLSHTRRQWLIEQGLAREEGGQVRFARNMLKTLEARELARTAADISARTGLEHVDVRAGDKVDGVYRRMLTLNSGGSL